MTAHGIEFETLLLQIALAIASPPDGATAAAQQFSAQRPVLVAEHPTYSVVSKQVLTRQRQTLLPSNRLPKIAKTSVCKSDVCVRPQRWQDRTR